MFIIKFILIKTMRFFNFIYVSPQDLFDACFNIVYKDEIDKLNKEYDKAHTRMFIINKDGDITFNPELERKIFQDFINRHNAMKK